MLKSKIIINKDYKEINPTVCGCEECEDEVKAQAGVGSRCIYDEVSVEGKKCVCCGKDAIHNVVWAKAY